jgi:hypothetical protein
MAKSPGKAPDTTAPKPAAIAKPKAAKKTAGNGAAVKPAAAKIAVKPVKAAKPKPAKTKTESKSVFSEASSKISKIASDILEDRIVPTLDQIKAIAASVLGQDQAKVKKSKGKKKK